MNDEMDGGQYTVNYAELLKSKEVMAVTKLLASRLMSVPYMSPGDFLSDMSDSDLDTLMNAIEKEQYEDIILISEMLATAEGCDPSIDTDSFSERINAMVTFITIESLHRKGLVKVHHKNISFHPDSGSNVVVEKVDGLDYSSIVRDFK